VGLIGVSNIWHRRSGFIRRCTIEREGLIHIIDIDIDIDIDI
jgi:hypothetical protein